MKRTELNPIDLLLKAATARSRKIPWSHYTPTARLFTSLLLRTRASTMFASACIYLGAKIHQRRPQ
jgi:hypothetical protein